MGRVLSSSEAFRGWMHSVLHHADEEETMQTLRETTLKSLYANDYTEGVRSVVATRAVLLQLVPGGSVINIFSDMTSQAPLFVNSRSLELSLPELICRAPYEMAREI